MTIFYMFTAKNCVDEAKEPFLLVQNSHNWSESERKQTFSVNRATFQFLCRELQPHLQRSDAVQASLPLEYRVAVCIWRLGTSRVEYRTISHLFGVGNLMVCMVVHDVSHAIVEFPQCIVQLMALTYPSLH